MGELTREGESRPVTQDDLALNERAQSMQALQQVPVMQRSNNPHEYLFFTLFDGTGQDVNDPDQLPTNVGVLKEQLDALDNNPNNRIGFKYVEGIGTQDNQVSRAVDGAFPYTWDDKIEKAYRALSIQTSEWQRQDPEAKIRLADVGYSRGAVLVPGLARLVDQYGIAPPEDLKFGRDTHGNITVNSPHPPLVPPGQTAQAVALYDPVATNTPPNYDARLPPSVISALSMTAAHEQRTAFPHQAILEPGLSEDRRFVNVLMPGGHSNVGGGNQAPGLETLAFNQMADYLNRLRDEPVFDHRPLPDDPNLYTVYQSHGITAVPGMDKDNHRDMRQELASCKIVDPCRDREPINQALASQFEYRHVQLNPIVQAKIEALIEQSERQEATGQPGIESSGVESVRPTAPIEQRQQGAAPQSQAPSSAPSLQQDVLRLGSQGMAVIALQQSLRQRNIAGQGGQPVEPTGTFDQNTQTAVQRYQLDQGLEVTGQIDHAAFVALQQAQGTDRGRTAQEQDVRQVPAQPAHAQAQSAQTPLPSQTLAQAAAPSNDQATPPANPPPLPANFAPPLRADDLRDRSHPGHADFARTLSEVHRMETVNNIAHGPHSEQAAAALMLAAMRNGHGITNVEMGRDGKLVGLERAGLMQPAKEVSVDSRKATSVSMEAYAAQWAQARSPHYASAQPAAERTPEQAQALAQLTPGDQALFSKIRGQLPAQMPDDQVLQATLQTKQAGIETPEALRSVVMQGDRLYMLGTAPGFRTSVDLAQPAAQAQATMEQVQQHNLQREAQLAQQAQALEQQQGLGRTP